MFDVSTPEKELAAYLLVFKEIDEMGSYSELDEIVTPEICQPCAKDLHDFCVAGPDGRAFENCACEASKNCADRAKHYKREHRQAITWKKWYDEAKAGNGESAKKLLKDRSHRQYEYEVVEEGTVMDPLEETKNAAQTA